MQMIKFLANDNGSRDNQSIHGALPDGWAILPADMETPNFPFGEIEAAEIDGVMTVIRWIPGQMPKPEPVPAPEPTQMDRIEAQVTYTAMMTGTLMEV